MEEEERLFFKEEKKKNILGVFWKWSLNAYSTLPSLLLSYTKFIEQSCITELRNGQRKYRQPICQGCYTEYDLLLLSKV